MDQFLSLASFVLSCASFAIAIVQLVLLFVTKPRGRSLALAVLMIVLLLAGGVALWQVYVDSLRVRTVCERITKFLSNGEQTLDGLYDGLLPTDFPYLTEALNAAVEKKVVQFRLLLLLGPDGKMVRTRTYSLVTPLPAGCRVP
jgi:hypothetical protein